MKRHKQRYQTVFGRVAFNGPDNPFDDTPITDEELEDWERSFDEDLASDEEEG